MLASSIKGIISQTLAKRLCPICKIKRAATYDEKILFKKVLNIDTDYVYEARGCNKCHDGYTGRIALQEVLYMTDEIKEAINNNIPKDKLKLKVYNTGTKTLLQDGLIKVLNGQTDLKEVFKLVDFDENDALFNEKKKEEHKEVKNVFNNLREN